MSDEKTSTLTDFISKATANIAGKMQDDIMDLTNNIENVPLSGPIPSKK